MAREEKKGRTKGGNEKEEKTQKVHRRNQHKLFEHQPKAKMERRDREYTTRVETVWNYSKEGEGGKKAVMAIMEEKESKGLRGHTYILTRNISIL